MHLDYNAKGDLCGMSFDTLTNFTHRLSTGANVTYEAALDDEKPFKVVAIGSNKTEIFKTASICFSIIAEPNYNIGEIEEDTSLYVTFGGYGNISRNSIRTAHGYVVGTLGCGCYAFGHASPTRLIWWWGVSSYVTDVAVVCGTWRMIKI